MGRGEVGSAFEPSDLEADQAGADPRPLGSQLAPGYSALARLHGSAILDVYDVWSEQRACRCIAKTLSRTAVREQRQRDRLRREGRLLLSLTHPHIVRAYELLETPEPILILETLAGATLGRLIAERGRLGVADVVLLGLQLSSAVHYLHRNDTLHLDLKPSNIIVGAGLAKVIDLSIAQAPGPGRRGVGTRQYLAPEQARGDQLGPAVDVWGIGVVLFEATTERKPFRSYRAPGRYEQLERQAERIRSLRRVPTGLARAIESCLEPDPTERPSVDDLLRTMASLAR